MNQTTLFEATSADSGICACETYRPPEPPKAPTRRCSGSSGHPGAMWRAWTADTDEQHAAAAFLRRYGVHPEYIVDGIGGLLLVGPVPEVEL